MALRNMNLGTYQPNRRPVVTTAPDAIIFINGQRAVDICRDCSARFEVDSHVTQVSTSLSIDGAGNGNASVSISIPRSSNFPFIQDGRPFISNMSEIEIYFKGFYLINGMPRYYPAFWGLVTNVASSYNSGVHTFALTCKDILHWWAITKLNVSPALISSNLSKGHVTPWKNKFANKTPVQIIVELARQTMGESLVPAISSLNTSTQITETAPSNFALSSKNLIDHWKQRRTQIVRALRFFGANGGLVLDGCTVASDICKAEADGDRSFSQIQTAPTITGTSLDLGLDAAKDFNPFSQLAEGGIQLFESDANYSSKLEVAIAVKDWLGFEFYLDTTGEIIFKPPFYNIDVKPNFPVSWIRDTEILSFSFGEDEPECTRIEIRGGLSRLVEGGPAVVPAAYHTDYTLARQYGIRSTTIERNWIRNATAAYLHAVSELDRITTRRFQATLEIIGRHELRLGYPIYIESQDTYWYVTDISHSFSFGGSFTTSLGLTARRPKFADVEYAAAARAEHQEVDESGVARDDKGKNEGIRNAVLRHTRDTTGITEDSIGYRDPSPGPKQDRRQEEERSHGRVADTPAGIYVPDVNPKVRGIVVQYPQSSGEVKLGVEKEKGSQKENLPQSQNGVARPILGGNQESEIELIKFNFSLLPSSKIAELGTTEILAVLPVSDENGYELVGAFPYGRSLRLTGSGTLAKSVDSLESAAEFSIISPQALDEPKPDLTNRRVAASDQSSAAGVFQVDQTSTGVVFSEMTPERRTKVGCFCKAKQAEFDLEFLKKSFSGLFDDTPSVQQNSSTIPQISITDQQKRDIDLQTDLDVTSPTAADIGNGGRTGRRR